MRVLPLAIGTLSALSVNELGYTRSTSPSSNPTPTQQSDPANLDAIDTTQQSDPIALPEKLPVPEFAQGMGSATKPTDPLNALKGKNQNLSSIPPLQPLNLQLPPIDDVVNETLKPRASQSAPTQKATTRQAAIRKLTQPKVVAARSQNSTANPAPTDIQGHWAQPVIEALVARKVVQGFSDGRFHPDRLVSPDEFMVMAQKALPQAPPSVQELQQSYPNHAVTRADAAVFVYQKMVQAGAAPTIAIKPTTVASAGRVSGLAPANIRRSEPIPEKTSETAQVSPAPGTATTPFPPNTPIPTATRTASRTAEQDYTLGAGDSIRLDVFDVPEYSKEYKVLVNGTLNLPLLGNVAIGGLTLQQAGNLLSAKYAPYLTRPRVTVTLLMPRPLNVAVSGEVNRPGSYTVPLTDTNKFPTVSRVVQMAGGITQGANLRQVEVRRPQRSGTDQVIQVNLWELLQTGDLRQDLVLRDGDTVFIPPAQSVNLAEAPQLAAANFAADPNQPLDIAVVGEVVRPGPHTLTKTADTPTGLPTVTRAIQQAGGITQAADIRRVEVHRAARSGTEQVINVNLWQLLQEGDLKQDLILQQGDRVVIPVAKTISAAEATQIAAATFSPKVIKVNVVGEVEKPGTVEVSPSTPLNQALLTAGGFTNRARKKSVQLIRLNPNGTVTQQKVTVDLAANISDQVNPMLQNNDIIVVGRSSGARLSDTLDKVLTPLGRILPLFLLF